MLTTQTGQHLRTFLKGLKFTSKEWSGRYNYYNIQFDKYFSQKLEKSIVVNCILETKLFRQTNHQSFTNSDKFPWANIILVHTYDGNFASSEQENQFVTLVSIVCLKGENVDQQIYINTFRLITDKLNWKLYLEEDDNGNENIEL